MGFLGNLTINIYSIILLIIIDHHSSKQADKDSMQYKIYMSMLRVTAMMIIFDICGRSNNYPDTFYQIINHLGYFMVYLITPILPSLWILYVYCQINHNEEKIKRLIYPLIIVNAANAIFLIISQFFGYIYYIDSNNIYHRGPLFYIIALFTIILLFFAFILVILNRKKIDKKNYLSLVFFGVPPLIGFILNSIFYGISLSLNSAVISLLIIFLNIQNRSIYIDYLTGVNNRKKLDVYLKNKINACTAEKTFSAILLDLNNFKSINDTFGHDMGDKALGAFTNLLKLCLRSHDFIARFGGDEFYVVLNISDKKSLEGTVRRIKECINKFNDSDDHPYKISVSMGYAVYDYNINMKPEEFQKHLDILMYKDKKNNKKLTVNNS
ncbi:MAG: diguanylate cyclase protein [Clostridia bacterium]|nr:diguanylate cyclase protein [Clostridia bacterium]